MKDRTIILVSHHVQLCAAGASYVVALDSGRVLFEGDGDAFQNSGVIRTLVQSTVNDDVEDKAEAVIESDIIAATDGDDGSESSSTAGTTTIPTTPSEVKAEKKPTRKLVEEEARAIGRVGRDVWITYFVACGSSFYWSIFVTVFILAALSPVIENGWLRYWSYSVMEGDGVKGPLYYITIYASVSHLVIRLYFFTYATTLPR